MTDRLFILILEDYKPDAELLVYELKASGLKFQYQLVETKEDYIRAIREFQPDIILSDYMLPRFDGMTALQIKEELIPGTPFIIITGDINEETAKEVFKAGASGYVFKNDLKKVTEEVRKALGK
jgi:CheY-like chemotaxis protein